MGDPDRSIGFTTTCSVGVEREIRIVFVQSMRIEFVGRAAVCGHALRAAIPATKNTAASRDTCTLRRPYLPDKSVILAPAKCSLHNKWKNEAHRPCEFGFEEPAIYHPDMHNVSAHILTAAALAFAAFLPPARGATANVFSSVRASHDLPLTTDPASEFWSQSQPVELAIDNFGKPQPGERTQVFSRWTPDSLYFLFVCPYNVLSLKPNPQTMTETNRLWNWDVAEVFLGSDFHNIRRYKEFEISPQGEWVDLDVNLDRPHHEDGWVWNSGFQVQARIDAKTKIWYGAMRIPFRAIAPQPVHAGTTFRINLFRTEGPAPATKSVVWQAPMQQSFHVPEKFGTLRLVDSPKEKQVAEEVPAP